jgi:DNA-binding NarL/FixJ family response regulator
METVGQRLCWRATAQLALARGDADGALAILDALIGTARSRESREIAPHLWKLRAEVLHALGRVADANQALQAARDAAVTHQVRPLLWRIETARGRLLHNTGRRREARLAFESARAVVEELAQGVPDGLLRSTFLRQAALQLPPVRAVSADRRAKERFGGLTARERDVALRIARGKSNRVIAQEMVVGERTVEGYVGAILNKLAFRSRAEVAAWAVATGLAADAESTSR